MMTIRIEIPKAKQAARLNYLLEFIFSRVDGLELAMNEGQEATALCLHSKRGEFIIDVGNTFLSKSELRGLLPGDSFDLINGIGWYRMFFFLTQMDKYSHEVKDAHGRWIPPNPDDFWPDRSKPFLDEAIHEFLGKILGKFDQDWRYKPEYRPVISVDIDQWYAYRYKSWPRNVWGLIRDFFQGRWKRNVDRIQSVLRLMQDPYDTLDWMKGMCGKYDVEIEAFVLPEAYTMYDKQVSIPLKEKKEKVQGFQEVGLHPTYYALTSSGQLDSEKIEFERVFGTCSSLRYHYLREEFPVHYSHALRLGFKKDKTLITIGGIGFINGTCHPHRYYDLKNDASTDLMIVPQLTMDVFIKDYLQWPRDRVVHMLKPYLDIIKFYQGTASIVWHNSSFDPTEGWGGYDQVFTHLVENMKSE